MPYEIKKRNILLIGLFSSLILFFILKGDFKTMYDILVHINIAWLSLGFLCIFIYWGIEASTFHLMLTNNGEKISYFDVLKLVISTQFFNGITPFSTGGQPFQIYILTKKSKLSASSVTSASVHNFIVYQFILVVLGSVAFCLKYFFTYFSDSSSKAIGAVALLGFSLNIFVVFSLILFSSTPNVTRKIVFSVLRLLEYTPLKKRIIKTYPHIEHFLKHFHRNSQGLMKNRLLMFKASLLNLIKLTVFYLIAYFTCRSIGFNNVTIVQAVIASAYIMLITSFIPLPGASGGSELGFMFLFGTLLTAPQVMVVMVLWRFITYYFGLFVGFVTLYFGYPNPNRVLS